MKQAVIVETGLKWLRIVFSGKFGVWGRALKVILAELKVQLKMNI